LREKGVRPQLIVSVGFELFDVRHIEADVRLKLGQIELTAAEELLTIRKVR